MNNHIQQPLFNEKSYYNTTHLNGTPLVEAHETAKAQEENCLVLYNEIRIMSPSECWKMYKIRYNGKVLLTSIRRSITTLTKKEKLMKTGVQRDGEYGRPEYVWKINEEQQ